MEWFLKVVRDNYANFDGRARRQEFWMYILIYIVISIIVTAVARMIHFPMLSNILGLALLVPSLAVGSRRLHDIGKSGWMQLVGLIPIAGIIWLIVLWAKEGDQGDNSFGTDPKAAIGV